MKMKKFLAALLALVMVLSLAACGDKSDDAAADDADLGNVDDFVSGDDGEMVKYLPPLDDPDSATLKETVIIANVRDMTTVNPYDTNTTEVLNMLRMTHSRMFRQNPETYELENDLCTEYEQVDDLHWVFKLRDDVVFHNGEKMTADDVVYSFNRMKEYSYTAAKTEFIEEVVKVAGGKKIKNAVYLWLFLCQRQGKANGSCGGEKVDDLIRVVV